MNKQMFYKTYSGPELRFTKKEFHVKPGGVRKSINSKHACYSHGCNDRSSTIKVTIDTKARTPFFLSGPEFSFVFSGFTGTTQSWLDVIITTMSEKKSVTSLNCLELYYIHESIFRTSNFFSKSVPSNS